MQKFSLCVLGLFVGASIMGEVYAEPKKSQAVINKGAWGANDKDIYKNNEYYTALFNDTSAIVNSASDCVDNGVLSWLRKLVKKDSAEVSFIAKYNFPGEAVEKSVPLFSYGKSERKVEGQYKCHSYAYRGQITPWVKAGANKSYGVTINYGLSDFSDITAARNLSAVASEMASFSVGTHGFMVKQLAGEKFETLASKLDKSVSDHLEVTSLSSNRIELDSVPHTDLQGRPTLRSISFKPADISAGASGVNIVSGQVSFTLGLRVSRSLFADEAGNYLDWPAVLSINLAGSDNPSQGTLKALIDSGVGGVSATSLKRISSVETARDICSDLSVELAKGFTKGDVAIAKYSILSHYSPQVLNTASLRDEKCFNAQELATVSSAGFSVPELRKESDKRDEDVRSRQNGLFKAIRSGDLKSLEPLVVSNRDVLRFRDLSEFMSSQGAKSSVTGDAVLPTLLSLGQGMSYGCYQAPPAGALNQIGAVINVRGTRMGVISYYSADGLVTQVTIGSVDEIGRMAGLGEGYPSPECSI